MVNPPGAGWRDWCGWNGDGGPYRHHLVEAWRQGWQEIVTLRIADIGLAANVAGLWWRPLPHPKLEPEVDAAAHLDDADGLWDIGT